MSDKVSFEAVRSGFIEKSGLISQAEGLPRIAGRVFGLLIFDGEMVSFGDLATRLQVSRASISSSIRLLEERGLIKRMTKPGERQDFFQLAPNPYATMLEGIQKRTQSTRDDIADTIASLPSDADAVERLKEYADFYASLDSAVAVALQELTNARNKPASKQPQTSKDKSK
ncbi:GbsR/MarR family transcriptional regulator [Lentibacter sp.]|uniref:GbsR/MarR family transcriptional regulator n=1 Tax=Lentibacter sp. TaxID=2024994 RepID=UPI003F6BA1C0